MRGADYVLMARRRSALTQRELAERLGCRQATIARWERGDRQVSIQDVEAVARVCGLQLEAHLAVEDRSWWPQIATQVEFEPIERVRRLTPAGGGDVADALEALAATDSSAIVIGEVAGALHGWPLVLDATAIEVCPAPTHHTSAYKLARGPRVTINETPSGTFGFSDLMRGTEKIAIGSHDIHVAGLVDLLRIAEASPASTARRDALAYQATLDVRRAREAERRPDARTAEEKIDTWLTHQTPAA
jgi:transcriptional regulator with XRE-family HTH domain